jgi:hypothetical protein
MTDNFNDPIAALRTELASVSASPGFAERVRERLADDLEPLRAELTDLAVSPDFVVRVRQNIEATGARRGFSWSRFNWRLAVPAAGLAAAAVLAVAYLRSADAPAPVQFIAQQPALSAPPSPALKATDVPPTAGVQAPRPTAARVRTATDQAPAVRETDDPLLEVITDQPAILRALWVRVEPGVTVDSTEPADVYEAPKLEVAPIEISPISKFVVPDMRAPIGVTPIILRFGSVGTAVPHLVTAESAERSSR